MADRRSGPFASGSGNTTITVGAAIGGTTAFQTGIDASSTSTGAGTRTVNVAGTLAGNYTATGSGATTVNRSAGSISGNLARGDAAGVFNWTGGTLGGGNGVSAINVNLGAGQVRTLANAAQTLGQVQSGTPVLNARPAATGRGGSSTARSLGSVGTSRLPAAVPSRAYGMRAGRSRSMPARRSSLVATLT